MAIQANALPPSLVSELQEMQRRITALERKPKLGSVNERLPFSSYQTVPVIGSAGPGWSSLGAVNSTGLNQPVLIMALPFSIPWGASAALDVSITVYLRDMITQTKSASITLTKANDDPANPGFTQNLTWAWRHPQPIGFDDTNQWKGFAIDYIVNKRANDPSGDSVTVRLGAPNLVTGVPLGTFLEEADDGNPRIGGPLTPTDGSPVTWTG
ncbi:minor tail protein [Streptomyces phage Heather]|uniref:Minor tail protein n=1 Tax=Streptomyces phage Heather TaxID=2562343 RepID=A0A4D6E457_9CAUD|nr:minor tail protein [Streptomyces phage Heather]